MARMFARQMLSRSKFRENGGTGMEWLREFLIGFGCAAFILTLLPRKSVGSGYRPARSDKPLGEQPRVGSGAKRPVPTPMRIIVDGAWLTKTSTEAQVRDED